VISRADLLTPNGIRVNASGTKLYVTDSSATDSFPSLRGEARATGSPAIFVYDLGDDAFPVNKYMLGISCSGIPDGIHIDDANRICTGEFERVVVRNSQGKVLELFNSEAISAKGVAHRQFRASG
jgi:gluconolactonase